MALMVNPPTIDSKANSSSFIVRFLPFSALLLVMLCCDLMTYERINHIETLLYPFSDIIIIVKSEYSIESGK